jgi:hypothetical protein
VHKSRVRRARQRAPVHQAKWVELDCAVPANDVHEAGGRCCMKTRFSHFVAQAFVCFLGNKKGAA